MDTLFCSSGDCHKRATHSLTAQAQSGGLWVGRWCGHDDHSPRHTFELMGFEVIGQ
ncbi:hypothetical protein J2S59_000278 [Nocardioides massiliensis]|uniref:Uncharacterized protein n=1 Tax=Nocardioides massiliensis TaxID=1325935 RepID=A0ABT9NJP8_9ACTN|nr:hypothetical protein [Nocardioides massiliensis]